MPEVLAAQADRPRGHRRAADRRHEAKGSNARRDRSCSPTGGGWLLVEFGGETKDEADEQGPGADGATSTRGGGLRRREALRRPERASSTSGRCASPASAPRRSCPASPTRWEGWEDSAVAAGAAGRLPARAARSCSTRYGYQRRALRPLRPGLRPLPHRLRPRHRRRASRRSAASWTRRPTWCVALRRLALRRARRRPVARRSCCRRCSAHELVAGVPRVQGDLGPRLEDEPGQGRRPVPDRRRTCASAPTTVRRPPKTHFAVSRRRRQLRPRGRCAASASASAGEHERRRDVPELHGHARGEALDARPGAPALRDARAATCSTGGWSDEAVKESLDLCLACKGCKSDCPVNVDMATLQGRVPLALLRRPAAAAQRVRVRADRPVGAARVARARARRTSSRRRPVVSRTCARRLAGVAPERRLPRLRAASRFQALVRRPPREPGDGRPARRPLAGHVQQLLPPEVGAAAVEVLEARRLRTCVVPRAARSAAAGRSTTTACSTWPGATCERDAAHRSAARSAPACPWSASSRAASPCSATS